MSMDKHITSVCQSLFRNFRDINRIRKLLSGDAIRSLVHTTITSKLDYGNSLLAGITNEQLHRLQRAQNVAARLVTHSHRHDHITPVLKQLHWLPVKERINYKIALLVFKCLHGLAPLYLCSLITKRIAPRSLRSSEQLLCVVPPGNLMAGQRAFSKAGPKLWNNLPAHIRNCDKLEPFKSLLKTHLFS